MLQTVAGGLAEEVVGVVGIGTAVAPGLSGVLYLVEGHEGRPLVGGVQLLVEAGVGGDLAVVYEPVVERRVRLDHLCAAGVQGIDVRRRVHVDDVTRLSLTHGDVVAVLGAVHLEQSACRGGVQAHRRLVLQELEVAWNQRDELRLVRGQRQDELALVQRVEVALVGGVLECWTDDGREDSRGLHVVHAVDDAVLTEQPVVDVVGVNINRCTESGLHLAAANLLGEHGLIAVGKRLQDEVLRDQRIQVAQRTVAAIRRPVVLEETGDGLVRRGEDVIGRALQRRHLAVVGHRPLAGDVRQPVVGQRVDHLANVVAGLRGGGGQLGILVVQTDVV